MSRRLKIVVADDERDTREYLQEYVSHLGHDVRAAADGRQLVEICHAFSPDLIVTDYAMPGLDGLAIRLSARRADLPCGGHTVRRGTRTSTALPLDASGQRVTFRDTHAK